ncbi:hypothetical protein BRD00_13465 [Halobacteriales archaeon QS_8_69_26]|nr:MAG: hypothetical protein BRD00_13465 [Halobacteriales archaeon QS_8_69_26]
MNRDAIGPAVIAVVCALAVVVAAATLTSPVEQTGDSGVGSGEGGSAGGGDGDNVDLGGENDTPSGLANLGEEGEISSPICVHELRNRWVVLGGILAFLGIGLVFKRRYDSLPAVALTTSLGIPVFMIWLLLSSCPDRNQESGLPEMLSGRSSGGGQSGNAVDPNATVPPFDVPVAVVLVVGLALLVVLAVTLSDRDVFSAGLSPSLSALRTDDEEPAGEQASVFAGGAAAVGRAAGRAADRIEESEDLENEVYRAWVEMTRHLDVEHPESSTPAEFARAATEAGMDEEDVEELTWLFEEVRYGGRTATEERESRAIEALRRIESTYAGGSQ